MGVDISKLIDQVLAREGSEYTNRTADAGGPTKYGITMATYANALNKPARPVDIENMTETEARNIYQTLFWTKPHFDVIQDADLAGLVFDSGVQHGPEQVTTWLQDALGVVVDGDLGERSQAALQDCNGPHVYRALLARRMAHYGESVQKDPAHGVANIHGWLVRLGYFVLNCP